MEQEPITQDAETEFTLHSGSMWVTVGNVSVYILHQGDAVVVKLLPLDDAMSDELDYAVARFEQAVSEEA